jgi:hypothetical protein
MVGLASHHAQRHLCHRAPGDASYGKNIGICLNRYSAATKARITSGFAVAETSGWYCRRRRSHEAIKEYHSYIRGVACRNFETGGSPMRFIFGVFVGAALMLGSAYLHDTGVVRAGPKQPFVNWDIVIGMLGR